MYIQHFHNFRTDDVNHNKCVIANTCVRSIYGVNAYLYQINSPKIRTIFTKLRIPRSKKEERIFFWCNTLHMHRIKLNNQRQYKLENY